MYAVKADSFRAIASEAELLEGETVYDEVPQSVLDAIEAGQQSIAGNVAHLRDQADAALANLLAYRDLASPTNAQTVAVVRLLCRVCIALIRLVLFKLDGRD